MKMFMLSEELVNEILGYLGEQPYIKVAPIINRLGESLKNGPIPMPTPVDAEREKEIN